jgi:type II secretory pathway component PulF
MKPGSKRLSTLYSQLATMLESGVSIERSLRSLAIPKSAPEKRVIDVLREGVQSGMSLSSIMEEQCVDLLPRLDCHVLKACEESGALDQGLKSLAGFHEARAAAQSQILSASVLPAVLLVFAVIIVHVPPMILATIGPGGGKSAAEVMISLFSSLLLLCLSPWIVWGLWRLVSRSDSLRASVQSLTWRLPLIGKLQSTHSLYHWVESLRLLLRAGYGVVPAFQKATSLSEDSVIRERGESILPRMNDRLKVSELLEEAAIFPPIMVQSWATGEETGRMDDMLLALSNYFRGEWERSLKTLAAWIPRLVYALVSIFVVIQIFIFVSGIFETYKKVLQ